MGLPPVEVPGRKANTSFVREGTLQGGLPYLAVGQGPPLVVFSELTTEHVNPTGVTRWFEVQRIKR